MGRGAGATSLRERKFQGSRVRPEILFRLLPVK